MDWLGLRSNCTIQLIHTYIYIYIYNSINVYISHDVATALHWTRIQYVIFPLKLIFILSFYVIGLWIIRYNNIKEKVRESSLAFLLSYLFIIKSLAKSFVVQLTYLSVSNKNILIVFRPLKQLIKSR